MRFWNEVQKSMLRYLASQGKSGSEIAQVLSNEFGYEITRSMVAGQANRLKVKLTSRAARPQKKRVRIMTQKTEDAKVSAPCTIFELTRFKCHFPLWPHQSRAQPDFLFCGAKTAKTYCTEHEKVVYRGQTTEKFVPVKPGGMISTIFG